MKFEHSDILLLLWLILPLGGLMVWAFFRRKNLLERFSNNGLWKKLAGSVNWRMRKVKNILLVCVFIFSILALARPQWGFELQEVRRQGVDILLAVDVSKSMLTEDVAPNRLERTKLAIRDLLGRLHGDRVGLIAFAGDSFLLCPLTSDYGGVMLSMKDLGVQTIPRGGTNISSAITEALRIYKERNAKYKTLIILTDGENLEGDPVDLAKRAKDQGMRIYTVGIGTREGELIRVSNGQGGYEFLKDRDENFIKSRLNESLLQEISLVTKGLYVRASGAQFGLGVIYERELSKLEKVKFGSQMKRQYFERFQWPLGIAVILLVLATVLPDRKRE